MPQCANLIRESLCFIVLLSPHRRLPVARSVAGCCSDLQSKIADNDLQLYQLPNGFADLFNEFNEVAITPACSMRDYRLWFADLVED